MTEQLRTEALQIWRAGVDRVDSQRLVREAVRVEAETLVIAGERVPLSPEARICVVGAGKAGAGMAAGLEQALGTAGCVERLTGWINVPADCVRPLSHLHLHAARPAGVNEPTQVGLEGSERMLQMVSQLEPEDVCIVLLSGGGSALLPAPAPPVSLKDKQRVTRLLMQRGARIDQLNAVRKRLSRIKGGGLARACRAARMVCLIISDVIGDPLDVIASGPTVPNPDPPEHAVEVLEQFVADRSELPGSVWQLLEAPPPPTESQATPEVSHHVIGNIGVALEAARQQAIELGWPVIDLGSQRTGEARDLGRQLYQQACSQPSLSSGGVCLLGGGEPVVKLVETDQPRRGGRNQELVLGAVVAGWDDWPDGAARDLVVLSGGTDGEDGPTDAAGAVADRRLLETARRLHLNPSSYLAINNAYPFFDRCDGLIRTGPTHTNVMDLHLALINHCRE